jgi:hypothetical protein
MRNTLAETTQTMKNENSKLRTVIEETLMEKRTIEANRQSTALENQQLKKKVTSLEIKNQEMEHKMAELKI